MEPFETEDAGHGITIEYHYDEDPQHSDPRDCDNVGTMVCWHRRADLGDVTILPDNSDTETLVDFIREVIEDREGEGSADGATVVPLWLYEHSGMTMSASAVNLLADEKGENPYRCPWDSGQVGFAYVTAAKVEAEGITDPVAHLVAEVETYDLYLTGEVYGYVIEGPDGEHLDSLWGMLGDLDEYVRPEARSEAAWWVEAAIFGEAVREAEAAEDLTHGVPMWVAA